MIRFYQIHRIGVAPCGGIIDLFHANERLVLAPIVGNDNCHSLQYGCVKHGNASADAFCL